VDGSSTSTEAERTGRQWGGPELGEAGMRVVATVGLDIAKSVFQVHGIDAAGERRCSPPTRARPAKRSPEAIWRQIAALVATQNLGPQGLGEDLFDRAQAAP
jgi:hypothetical protein